MEIVHSEFKKGIAKVKVTAPEDLWYLSQIISAGDKLSGKTTRKITIGSADSKTSHVQKHLFLEIEVEKIELHADNLRVSGKVVGGSEEVARGSYHTFTLEQNTQSTIIKQEWLSYHKSRLQEAAQATHQPLLLCVFDRDDALIARTQQWGIDILTHLRGDPEKKDKRAQTTKDLYKEIIGKLVHYTERYDPRFIILASPGFYKEDLGQQITDMKLKQKLILATCSSARENALHEVLKRPETRHAVQQMRVAEETEVVDELLARIAQNGNVAYGLGHVQQAADAGAIEELLIGSEFIYESQQEKTFTVVNDLMKHVDKLRGKIHIISATHDAGKKLHGLGGVAALLRYKVE